MERIHPSSASFSLDANHQRMSFPENLALVLATAAEREVRIRVRNLRLTCGPDDSER